MRFRRDAWFKWLVLLSALPPALAAAAARAATVAYDVRVDTAALAGVPADSPDRPWALFLSLTSGGTPGVTTSAIASALAFGGGSAAAGDGVATVGRAGGDLTASVTLDTAGDTPFSAFQQNFAPGTTLRFRLTATGTLVNPATNTPDGLSVSILDSAGLPVPTTDPSGADSLVTISLSDPVTVLTYGGDPTRPTTGNARLAFAPPTVTPVPEPAAAATLLGLALATLRRPRRPRC